MALESHSEDSQCFVRAMNVLKKSPCTEYGLVSVDKNHEYICVIQENDGRWYVTITLKDGVFSVLGYHDRTEAIRTFMHYSKISERPAAALLGLYRMPYLEIYSTRIPESYHCKYSCDATAEFAGEKKIGELIVLSRTEAWCRKCESYDFRELLDLWEIVEAALRE